MRDLYPAIIFGFIFSSVSVFSNQSQGSELKLEQFLKSFLQQNEVLQKAANDAKISEQNHKAKNFFYLSELEFRPVLSEKEQNFDAGTTASSFAYEEKLKTLNGRLSQKLPFGLSLDLAAKKELNEPNPQVGSLDFEYSLGLSLPLVRNSFGSQQRLEAQSAKKESEAMLENLRWVLFQQCTEGFQIYKTAFLASEKASIASQRGELSRKALKVSEEAFRRKMIREIDILSARVEALSAEGDLDQSLLESQNASKKLVGFSGVLKESLKNKTDWRLSKPALQIEETILSGPPVLESHPQVQKIKSLVESAELQLKADQHLRRPAADLGFEIGERKGRTVGGELYKFNESFVSLFVKFNWAIFDTSKETTEISRLRFSSQAHELSLLQKNITLEWDQFIQRRAVEKKRLQLSQQKVTHLNRRVNRAMELLQSGRIQFDEYLRYSEAYFFEATQKLEAESQLLDLDLSLFQLHNRLPEFCEDFS